VAFVISTAMKRYIDPLSEAVWVKSDKLRAYPGKPKSGDTRGVRHSACLTDSTRSFILIPASLNGSI